MLVFLANESHIILNKAYYNMLDTLIHLNFSLVLRRAFPYITELPLFQQEYWRTNQCTQTRCGDPL